MEDPVTVSEELPVLFNAEQIQDKVNQVAIRISDDFSSGVIATVGVLPNSMVFMADLIRKITRPLTCDFLKVGTSEQQMDIAFGRANDFRGRDVLLVQGVVDTGITLNFITGHIEEHWKPRKLRVATLIDRQLRRKVDCPVDYACFALREHGFVAGYGLGYQERHRGKPYIGIAEPRQS